LNRRDFLKHAGITAAVASVIPTTISLAKAASAPAISPYQTTTVPSIMDSMGYVKAAVIQAPYLPHSPDVSTGIIEANQWKNAAVVKLNVFGDSATVENAIGYAIFGWNDKGLYGCMNLPTEKTIEVGYSFGLFVDTAHNGIPQNLQKDDCLAMFKVKNVNNNEIDLQPYIVTGSERDKVIVKGTIDYSPNIACNISGNSWEARHSCNLTEGISAERNVMLTFFEPIENIKPINPDYPNIVGLYVVLPVNKNRIFDYPIYGYSKNNSVFPGYPLADLTFLPKETITTTTNQSSTSSPKPIPSTTTQTTSKQSTTSMTSPIITRRDFLGMTPAQEIVGALLGVTGIGVGSAVACKLLRKQKS
jgi:hypothetical protein